VAGLTKRGDYNHCVAAVTDKKLAWRLLCRPVSPTAHPAQIFPSAICRLTRSSDSTRSRSSPFSEKVRFCSLKAARLVEFSSLAKARQTLHLFGGRKAHPVARGWPWRSPWAGRYLERRGLRGHRGTNGRRSGDFVKRKDLLKYLRNNLPSAWTWCAVSATTCTAPTSGALRRAQPRTQASRGAQWPDGLLGAHTEFNQRRPGRPFYFPTRQPARLGCSILPVRSPGVAGRQNR